MSSIDQQLVGSDGDFYELNCCDCKPGYGDYGTDDDDDGDDSIHVDTSERLAELLCTEGLDYVVMLVMDMGWDLQRLVKCVREDCLKIYYEEQARRKLKLMNLDGQVSLSMEILRCAESDSYMRLNAHFVDENWRLQKWLITYQCIPVENVDDFPTKAALRAVAEWGISNKISSFTYEHDRFDEGSLHELKYHVQDNRKLQFGLFCLPCCSTIFESMAEDAFEGNLEVIHKIEKLWCCGESHQMWPRTYETMKHAFEAHTKENYFAKDEYEHYFQKPSPVEWNQVNGLCQVLEGLYDVGKVLFETKCLTPNICLRYFNKLRDHLMKQLKNSDSFIANVAGRMLERFQKYFKQVFLVFAIATILDPRYKMTYIKFSSIYYGFYDGDSLVTTVFEAMRALFDEYVAHLAESEACGSDSISLDTERMSERPIKKQRNQSDDGSQWDSDYQEYAKSKGKLRSKTELEVYLEVPVLPLSAEFDILTYWRESSSIYPVLSRIAHDALSVPLSVVTGNDAYFVTRRLIDPRLKTAGREMMNALVCTQNWFQEC